LSPGAAHGVKGEVWVEPFTEAGDEAAAETAERDPAGKGSAT
jgi:ribosomal 30S subunit maturation factor RimM